MSQVTSTKAYNGETYEWNVTDAAGYKLGTLMRDSDGTWYAQAPNADFKRFEDGEQDDRKTGAIAWLEAR